MSRVPVDWSLYLVTSGTGRRTVQAAVRAAAHGAGVVQVRAKDLTTRDLLALVTRIADAVHEAAPDTRVLVDDRADVAWAARRAGVPVDGVHLGQDDLPVRAARELLGPDALIGLTTGTLELVRAANDVSDVIDYVGAGPYRRTPTKDSGRPPLGVEGYRPLVAASRVPVIAIGDIGPGDVGPLRGSGVAGVAVVRAVMAADDPGAAAESLRQEWDTA